MQHVCTDAWTTDMDASGCCWSNHTISHVTNQPLVTTKKQAIESWANETNGVVDLGPVFTSV